MMEAQLRAAYAARGADLITTYRYGPYKIVAMFRVGESNYWEVTAQASREEPWTQASIDAWLHEELVRQLDAWCATRAEAP